MINGCAPGDQGGGEHAGYTSCHAELYLLREEAVAIGRQHVLERVSLVRRRGVDCIHCVHLGLRWLGAPMDVQQRRLDDQIEQEPAMIGVELWPAQNHWTSQPKVP